MTLRAVITDWGGVLTSPLNEAVAAWLAADQIDVEAYKRVMRAWFQGAYNGDATLAVAGPGNLIHQLEDGSLAPAEFERLLSLELRTVTGGVVPPEGLLDRMFAEFAPVEHMYETILACRAAGLRTALLSNSWGNTYPRERWAAMFDAVVISGEVRMRKPAPEIFDHAVTLLEVDAAECVFIDDIPANIAAAEQLGMVGVLHTDPVETRARLGELFALPLA
ncbi:HAD family phosphatase [Actinocorallia longicatena]|uniref:Hydrolase of the HAD superfamily n=1 Tax=Actinocorallia longicatena TaxID=111803 RepID=A0ABP6QJ96_9ACTN